MLGQNKIMVYLLTEEDCEDKLTSSEIFQSIVSFFREQEGGHHLSGMCKTGFNKTLMAMVCTSSF